MRFIFCLLFYSFVGGLFAQNEDLKHDYLWATGYSSNLTDFNFGGTILDFNVDTVDVYYEYREIDMDWANTTICNETGSEILFYSNNLQVMSPFQIFPIPGGLNPDLTAYNNDRIIQGVLGLPIGKDSLFYILHVGIGYLPNDPTGQYAYIPQLPSLSKSNKRQNPVLYQYQNKLHHPKFRRTNPTIRTDRDWRQLSLACTFKQWHLLYQFRRENS